MFLLLRVGSFSKEKVMFGFRLTRKEVEDRLVEIFHYTPSEEFDEVVRCVRERLDLLRRARRAENRAFLASALDPTPAAAE